MEPESVDLSQYQCQRCGQILYQEFGKWMCECYEVGNRELSIGYHQIPPFWIEKEPQMPEKEDNPTIEPNDAYFSRFYDEKAKMIDRFHDDWADTLAECKEILEKPFNEQQKGWYQAAKELFSPNLRGSGRTYAMLTAAVMTALQNPNRVIYVIDHHPLQNPMNLHHIRRDLDRIIGQLPASVRNRVLLSADRQPLVIEYRTK